MKTNFSKNVKKAAKRTAFVLSLLAALAIALVVVFGVVWIIGALCDALSISAAARFWISLLSLLGPALELAVNIECNFFAVVDRLLPGVFPYRMPFEIFCFWRRVLRA